MRVKQAEVRAQTAKYMEAQEEYRKRQEEQRQDVVVRRSQHNERVKKEARKTLISLVNKPAQREDQEGGEEDADRRADSPRPSPSLHPHPKPSP